MKKREFFHNVFEMDQNTARVLKEKISKSAGLIRIMVHPYFVRQTDPAYYEGRESKNDQRVDIVEQGFQILIGKNTPKTPPIFLFEVHSQIAETTKELSGVLEQSGNEIYLVPTYPYDPEPYYLNKDGKRDRFNAWSGFKDLLKGLGVKKCIIGGMYLWQYQTGSLDGCVGATIIKLQEEFEVQVSTLTHPVSRKNVKNPDTKPVKE